MLVRTFERPMGLAVDAQRLTVGTRNQVWFLRNAPDIAPRVEPPGQHDACYLPRSSHVTGDIGVHEMAWVGDELWIVSTRFSCLCTLSPDYSFVPRWLPPLITALAAGQRETVAELPGFARGLALSGPYAFVGLSKIRKTSAMDGVPLAERRDELKCGIGVVDLRSGRVIAFLKFQTAVEEIFDVQLLPRLRFPEVIGFQQETIQHTFVVPLVPGPDRR